MINNVLIVIITVITCYFLFAASRERASGDNFGAIYFLLLAIVTTLCLIAVAKF